MQWRLAAFDRVSSVTTLSAMLYPGNANGPERLSCEPWRRKAPFDRTIADLHYGVKGVSRTFTAAHEPGAKTMFKPLFSPFCLRCE